MQRRNAFTHARRSFRPLERQLVFWQGLVYFEVLVVKLGLNLFLLELVDAHVREDMRFDVFRHGFGLPSEACFCFSVSTNCLPHEVVVK